MSHPSPSSPSSGSAPSLTCFTNCQLCLHGETIAQDLYFSPQTGLITPNYYYRTEGVERIDLGGAIVSAGFLDLQTNGMHGVHFSQLGRGKGKARVKAEGRVKVKSGEEEDERGKARSELGQEPGQEDEEKDDENEDETALARVAAAEVRGGVTGWWATVPTVEEGRWREVSD